MNGFNDYDRYGVEDAGSEKQKKITKIVLFIAAFALISMIVGHCHSTKQALSKSSFGSKTGHNRRTRAPSD